MDLFKTLVTIEEDPNIHTARLLFILNEFSTDRGKPIGGITKLVKLDFLLRYPLYFERAVEKKGGKTGQVKIKDYEKKSVESTMIRYHYGPWDHRYRAFINVLVGKGLVTVGAENNTILIGITKRGQEITNELAKQIEFEYYVTRVHLLKKYFDIGGMALKNFIYDTFPEIVSMKKGDVIR